MTVSEVFMRSMPRGLSQAESAGWNTTAEEMASWKVWVQATSRLRNGYTGC